MVDLHPEFSRQLLQAVPGGIAFVDRNQRIQWANAEFATMLARTQQSLLGHPARVLPFSLQAPIQEVATPFGKALLLQRELTQEPLVGRVLQLLPTHSIRVTTAEDMVGKFSIPTAPGLMAREAGLQRLVTEISRSRRYDNPLSCLIARVEATHADDIRLGVETLVAILKDQLRWVDVLVHWEAASVLVVLPETSAEAAFLLRDKLQHALVAGWLQDEQAMAIHWGLASWRRGDEAMRLIGRADSASRASQITPWIRSPQ
jgi:hypothetical protein